MLKHVLCGAVLLLVGMAGSVHATEPDLYDKLALTKAGTLLGILVYHLDKCGYHEGAAKARVDFPNLVAEKHGVRGKRIVQGSMIEGELQAAKDKVIHTRAVCDSLIHGLEEGIATSNQYDLR